MTTREHLIKAEQSLQLALSDVVQAAASLPEHGELTTVLWPFIVQCRARLNDTLPDDAWIMRASLDGSDVVVTAGQARALVEWWDRAVCPECCLPECSPGCDVSAQERKASEQLQKLVEAMRPLIEKAKESRDDQIAANNPRYRRRGIYVTDEQADAAIAAYDEVKGEVA